MDVENTRRTSKRERDAEQNHGAVSSDGATGRAFYDEQCENTIFSKAGSRGQEFKPIERCESIVLNISQSPVIEFGCERALYIPSLDLVCMPTAEVFENTESYYSVLFHELVHSTGHDSRLSRDPIRSPMPHEPQLFAREELVAEMGSAFLCGYAGIENKVIDESFKSVEYWSSKLENDPRLLMHASGHALKAVEYILGK